MKFSLAKDLSPLRAAAKIKIDEDAETFRLNFITPGSGQAMTYQEKYSEALAFLADPTRYENAHELLTVDCPHIAAEIGVTGDTAFQVAQIVVNMRDMWKQVSARIDGARIAAKDAVDAAANPAAIASTSQVDWNVHVL